MMLVCGCQPAHTSCWEAPAALRGRGREFPNGIKPAGEPTKESIPRNKEYEQDASIVFIIRIWLHEKNLSPIHNVPITAALNGMFLYTDTNRPK
jgi:hypothetical protein